MKKKLEKIKQQVIECTKCELSQTRNNSVAGKGNFKADVIFVGEAPGKNEDLKGEPLLELQEKNYQLHLKVQELHEKKFTLQILSNADHQKTEFQHKWKERRVKIILRKK